jgi:hypothetical protein
MTFLSHKLTPAERKYTTHEKELLAFIHALKQRRHFLRGAKFTVKVQNDHVTVRFFHQQAKFSSRQVRWAKLIAGIDLSIDYKPGKINVVPDALSRRPYLKLMLLSPLTEVAPQSNVLRCIKAEYEHNPTAAHLLKTTACHGSNPVYHSIGSKLNFIDNSRYRLYVPNNPHIKSEILHDCHDSPAAGHPSVSCMK